MTTKHESYWPTLIVICLLVGFGLRDRDRAGAADGQHGEPGSVVATGYEPDTQDKAYRTLVGQPDATSIATLTSTTTGEALIAGKQNVSCEAVFTAASQSLTVDCLFIRRDAGGTIRHTWWGGPRTLTASATLSGNGNTGYATDPGAVWDTAGATNCRIVSTGTPGTGTVDLWLGSY